MTTDRATAIALQLLRDNEPYIDDARAGANLSNSVVGSLLSIQHGIPRQYAEEGVRAALAILDREGDVPEGDEFTLARSGMPPLRFHGTHDEWALRQAIPPAYTEWLGWAFLATRDPA